MPQSGSGESRADRQTVDCLKGTDKTCLNAAAQATDGLALEYPASVCATGRCLPGAFPPNTLKPQRFACRSSRSSAHTTAVLTCSLCHSPIYTNCLKLLSGSGPTRK